MLDCSVTLAWFMTDEESAIASVVLDRVAQAGAFVPDLWPLEVGNALLVAERRRRLKPEHRAQALRQLSMLPIVRDTETAGRAWQETLALAEAYGLTLYDAAYLELSLRRARPLATLDRSLSEAAVRAGASPADS